MNMNIYAVPSVEKVFYHQAPVARPFRVRCLQQEEVSWQLAYTLTDADRPVFIQATVESELRSRVLLRQVRHMPVAMPCYPLTDDRYLRKAPGLYPDLLRRIDPHNLRAYPGRWDTLWVSVTTDGLTAGSYPVQIQITDEAGTLLGAHTQIVEVMDAQLPAQTALHTKWFHCDCLAEYYHVPVFSEEHWRIIENFVREAVHGGINMVLTPIHTPPLDTRIGGERLTTQLVDIEVVDHGYRFNMQKVRRWIDMCKRCGVQHYEMAHLFTQWGAKHAPKIVATVDGVEKRIFGWDTDAASVEYGRFLKQYVAALRQLFREEGIEAHVWWHISDEPNQACLQSYMEARNQVLDVLQGAHIIDALSNYEFYQKGLVPTPVVAIDHIEPFLENQVPDLWTYYCCAQHRDVPNTFMAMPGARTRILGMLMYKYHFNGFLQWGFNFYKSQYSDYAIDPYAITDGDGFAPSGDAFQVYPGEDGMPESSIRHELSREAFQDLRALELLSAIGGSELASAIVDGITLTDYPCDSFALLALRERINDAIASCLPAKSVPTALQMK